MQIHGNFWGIFPKKCIVWVGPVITPVPCSAKSGDTWSLVLFWPFYQSTKTRPPPALFETLWKWPLFPAISSRYFEHWINWRSFQGSGSRWQPIPLFKAIDSGGNFPPQLEFGPTAARTIIWVVSRWTQLHVEPPTVPTKPLTWVSAGHGETSWLINRGVAEDLKVKIWGKVEGTWRMETYMNCEVIRITVLRKLLHSLRHSRSLSSTTLFREWDARTSRGDGTAAMEAAREALSRPFWEGIKLHANVWYARGISI